MKSILLSVQPKWAEKILSGEKAIEVRKTAPKELPVRVYMYCTKHNNTLYRTINGTYSTAGYEVKGEIWAVYGDKKVVIPQFNGKVVAEFIVNKVDTCAYAPDCYNEHEKMYYIKSGELGKACLTYEELCAYGKGKTLYGWHITDLKVYDEPLELREFDKPDTSCGFYNPDLERCDSGYNCERCVYNDLTVTRPPQSYMFVRRRDVGVK